MELIRRRNMLGASGSAIDWESIARGMIDCTTAFEVPSSITIGATLANAGYIFNERKGLSGEVTIDEGTTVIGYNLFYNCINLRKVNLPSTLTTIRNNAFQQCRSLTNITLPNSVTTIGNNCFSGCESLSSVNIPTGVTTLNAYVFQNCKALKTVTIPSSITSMLATFVGSGIETITIPSSVTSIGIQSFQQCISLAEIILEATTPPTLANVNAFYGCTALTSIYVPDASVNAYKTANNWSNYASLIKPISEMGGVADYQPLSGWFFTERRAAA